MANLLQFGDKKIPIENVGILPGQVESKGEDTFALSVLIR